MWQYGAKMRSFPLMWFTFTFILGRHVGPTRVPDVGPGVFREGAARRRRAPQTSPAPLTSGKFTFLTVPQSTGTDTHTRSHTTTHTRPPAQPSSLSSSSSVLSQCWPLLSESHWSLLHLSFLVYFQTWLMRGDSAAPAANTALLSSVLQVLGGVCAVGLLVAAAGLLLHTPPQPAAERRQPGPGHGGPPQPRHPGAAGKRTARHPDLAAGRREPVADAFHRLLHLRPAQAAGVRPQLHVAGTFLFPPTGVCFYRREEFDEYLHFHIAGWKNTILFFMTVELFFNTSIFRV